MKKINTFTAAIAVSALLLSCDKFDHGHHLDGTGNVYTLNNDTGRNSVLHYTRTASGKLYPAGAVPTGGRGSGGGLGSQGAISLSKDHKWLFAVNAGSDNISVLKVSDKGLTVTDLVFSEGSRPISVTNHGNRVYVLNAGGKGNIAGFYLQANGTLSLIPGSGQPLSTTASNPAQISFTRDGSALIVTEKATNTIQSWDLDTAGVPIAVHSLPSAGSTPFGFAVGKEGKIFVSEAAGGAADASSLSVYRVDSNANVSLVDGPVATTETAACWVVLTSNGKYCYTTNAGSNSISGFRISPTGNAELLHPNGITAQTGTGPIDAALSARSKFLYVLTNGSHTIQGFAVNDDGSLKMVEEKGGFPAGTSGLAAK